MMLATKEFNTDILVVGGGGAGSMAAIKGMAEGAEVLVATKGPFPSGNTSIAARGYAVALGHAAPNDNPDAHFEDVIRAGQGLNNRKVVRAWVNEIVDLTKEMDTWGIGLIRKGDKFAQLPWGGHTYPRLVHHHMTTGKSVTKCLSEKSRQIGVQALENTIVGGLFKGDDRVVGAWGVQYRTGQLLIIKAKAVILATGGMGHLFPKTDNIKAITGEGYSLAFRAGAELVDMEMTRFQLFICYPKKIPVAQSFNRYIRPLINSGGARLYNGLGERFMKKHYPDTGERQRTREQLTRAIGLELCQGRASAHEGVYLDASDAPPEMQNTVLSEVWSKFGRAGIDLSYQPIELAPYPHDFLGGVRINETAATGVRGLFAAGETAGGSHGAGRLVGSALSDALAFGAIAGKSAAHYARKYKKPMPLDKEQLQRVQQNIMALCSKKGGIKPSELKKNIEAVAHKYLNVVRNEEGLKKALQELERIKHQMLPLLSARETSRKKSAVRLKEALEVQGQLDLAALIATSALGRQESREGLAGGHYRSDYPSQDNKNWTKNIVLKSEQGGISSRMVLPVEEAGLISPSD